MRYMTIVAVLFVAGFAAPAQAQQKCYGPNCNKSSVVIQGSSVPTQGYTFVFPKTTTTIAAPVTTSYPTTIPSPTTTYTAPTKTSTFSSRVVSVSYSFTLNGVTYTGQGEPPAVLNVPNVTAPTTTTTTVRTCTGTNCSNVQYFVGPDGFLYSNR